MKPSTNSESVACGFRPRLVGTSSSAASDPTTLDSTQPTVTVRDTRTPSSRDTSGANAAARICRPSDVHRNRTASAAITTTATTSTNRSYGESSGTPPTTIALSSNGTRIGR